MNNGANSTAVDFTVAMNPCAFPCKGQIHQQWRKTSRYQAWVYKWRQEMFRWCKYTWSAEITSLEMIA